MRAELTVPSRLDALSYVDVDGNAARRTVAPTYPTEPTPAPYGTNSVLVTDGSAVSPGSC